MKKIIQNVRRCNELLEIAREFLVAAPGEAAEVARDAGVRIGSVTVVQGMPDAEALVSALLCDYDISEQAEMCRESDAKMDDNIKEVIIEQRMKWAKKWAESMLPKVASFSIAHIDERSRLGIIRFKHSDEHGNESRNQWAGMEWYWKGPPEDEVK